MGLLTKLNLLTIGLLFVTAIATSGFYLWQQWRDENNELHRRGAATLAMLAELAEFGLSTKTPGRVDAILDTLSADTDIAYVVVLDTKREPVAARRVGDAIGATAARRRSLPMRGSRSGDDRRLRRDDAGQRFLEMIAPIGGTRRRRRPWRRGQPDAAKASARARPRRPPATSGSA
jgi:hypothetical protein